MLALPNAVLGNGQGKSGRSWGQWKVRSAFGTFSSAQPTRPSSFVMRFRSEPTVTAALVECHEMLPEGASTRNSLHLPTHSPRLLLHLECWAATPIFTGFGTGCFS